MWTKENRTKYNRDHLRYPSDLTDGEWTLVEPFIPPAKSGGGKRRTDMREVMNGVMYILSTGCQWRYLPKDFPPRSTVHNYFIWWQCDGVLDRINHALYVKCREKAERDASPTACIIDSQSVKSAEKGGPASIRTGSMRANRSSERVRAATQALDCRTHHCLAQPLPPPRQGLGKSQPKRPRILETRVHSSHVAKAL